MKMMRTAIGVVTTSLLLAGWAVALSAAETNTLVAAHASDLVVLQGQALVPYDATRLKAPVIVLYFGAGWCPDCRKFSPKLVAAYNAQPKEKTFEVLFISRDKNEEGMLRFMKTEKMPWPALSFSKVEGADDLKKFFSGKGIPCLTIIDAQGRVLKQSASDQDAEEVLAGFFGK
jgi:nucleoredoxin